MNLDTYKEQLRSEILTYFEANGVRATLRKTGLNSKIWYNIKHGKVIHAETLEKYLESAKNCLPARKRGKQ